MERVAVIMAGGRGERLWPKSRKDQPKQFLFLGGEDKSLIVQTVERMKALTGIKNVFIVTSRDYFEITRKQLPDLPVENIICEPMGKNTTACIGYACQVIKKRMGDAIMMVVPSDHVIKDVKSFQSDLAKCCEIAERENVIVTVGVTPTKPETGFGYIKLRKDKPIEYSTLAWKMAKFVEKPDIKGATRYVNSGKYLWNAGMFIFPVGYMLRSIKKFCPHNAACLANIGKALGKRNEAVVTYKMFEKMESISIDYAVMEHVRGSITVQSTFGWNDVGTWAAIPEIQKADANGNYITGVVTSFESSGNIVEVPNGKLVALLGVKDLVIVESGNAILVCHKDYAQQIKEATKQIADTAEYL
jgi:mannose-1-phosphate guanylyltransferase